MYVRMPMHGDYLLQVMPARPHHGDGYLLQSQERRGLVIVRMRCATSSCYAYTRRDPHGLRHRYRCAQQYLLKPRMRMWTLTAWMRAEASSLFLSECAWMVDHLREWNLPGWSA